MYKNIIVNTFDTIFKNSNNLIQKLIIPIILITIINFFIPQFISQELINKINIQTINLQILLIPILLGFTLMMINISIAITTHRVSILGENSVPSYGSYIFGLREFKFLFKSIIFAIVIAIPIIITAIIPIIGIFIAPIIAIIFISRLSLVFPAIACDEKMSLYESWKYTRKYTLLAILMIIIFPSIFSFTVGLVYTLAIEFLITLVSPHMIVLYSILNVFILVFSISALSSVYKYVKPLPLNKSTKNLEEPIREIIQSTRKGVHKVLIHDKHKVNFDSLKKELEEQYIKLDFTDIAYNRSNAWIVKTPLDEEAYVSLRYEGDEFTINTKNTEEPNLKILKSDNKKK